jgi:hypothetical protein
MQQCQESDLWKEIYKLTEEKPASYAIRLYGYLLSSGISTINDFMKIELNDIFKIKGIGEKYQETLLEVYNVCKS